MSIEFNKKSNKTVKKTSKSSENRPNNKSQDQEKMYLLSNKQ